MVHFLPSESLVRKSVISLSSELALALLITSRRSHVFSQEKKKPVGQGKHDEAKGVNELNLRSLATRDHQPRQLTPRETGYSDFATVGVVYPQKTFVLSRFSYADVRY